MISSLEDAWGWYEGVRTLAGYMERLGAKFWDREEWAEPLGRDNLFRYVEAAKLKSQAELITADLNDVGVFVIFSAFEAIVRDRAVRDVKSSLPEELHPAVAHAVRELQEDLKSGSFGKVTEAFKSMDPNLVAEVRQVRVYRNWVAQGRREKQPSSVTPRQAYDRLSRFLQRMAEVAVIPEEDSDSPLSPNRIVPNR